jgi:uncharacterized membrane protein
MFRLAAFLAVAFVGAYTIAVIAVFTLALIVVVFGTIYALACACFWLDERKRREVYRARHSYSALRYECTRDTIETLAQTVKGKHCQ